MLFVAESYFHKLMSMSDLQSSEEKQKKKYIVCFQAIKLCFKSDQKKKLGFESREILGFAHITNTQYE